MKQQHKKKIGLIIPLVILAIALFVWFFQWLWNILLPDILGVKSINYWQAFGVLILSKILFGGMRFHKKSGHFKQKLEQFRDATFSDEDKTRLREEWMQRWKERCKNN